MKMEIFIFVKILFLRHKGSVFSAGFLFPPQSLQKQKKQTKKQTNNEKRNKFTERNFYLTEARCLAETLHCACNHGGQRATASLRHT